MKLHKIANVKYLNFIFLVILLVVIYYYQLIMQSFQSHRPQILVLSGMPRDRPALVDICSAVTKNLCLMVCGHVVLVSTQQFKVMLHD